MKAHEDLVAALEDLHTWDVRRHNTEELLKPMLQCCAEAARISKKYDTRWVQGL